MANANENPQYVGERDIAALTSIPLPTLRTWRCRGRRGGPPFRKIGARVLYRLDEVLLWLDERRVDPPAGPDGGGR